MELLPQPRAARLGGRARLSDAPRVVLENPARPLLTAGQRLVQLLREAGWAADLAVGRAVVREGDVVVSERRGHHPQGYVLVLGPCGARIEGNDVAGQFYGLQTLAQIVQARGRDLPGGRIEDYPALPRRGYCLDISRGRVPTLATLRQLVDRLASLKINELQLYIEHTFAFRFDPEISRGESPLTPGEILELDVYCRDRCVELVPCLACLGHMGRILSLAPYRDLAEVEWPAPDWQSASWLERARGATLNPSHPRARMLLRQMTDEFLPLFAADRFNACCDEPYDLGKASRRMARTALRFARHVRFLRTLARRHGKRLLIWGDFLLEHPQTLAHLPSDIVILDWGYSRFTPFDKVRVFREAGFDAYVCPSVRGYRLVFPDIEQARANIAGYARAGARWGAIGLLNTDWGDHGHFNVPAGSLHGMALGAALSWNPRADEGAAFDRAFSLHVFGDSTGSAAAAFRRLGSTQAAAWSLLAADWTRPPEPLPPLAEARRASEAARTALAAWRRIRPQACVSAHDLEELCLAARALDFNAEKIRLYHALAGASGRRRAALRARLRRFGGELLGFAEDYARAWLAAYKPARLADIRETLLNVARTAPSATDRAVCKARNGFL